MVGLLNQRNFSILDACDERVKKTGVSPSFICDASRATCTNGLHPNRLGSGKITIRVLSRQGLPRCLQYPTLSPIDFN